MAQSRQVALDSLVATPEHQQAVAGIVQLKEISVDIALCPLALVGAITGFEEVQTFLQHQHSRLWFARALLHLV